MDGCSGWEVLLITLWIQVGFVPEILCQDEAMSHLSREELLNIADGEKLKCFTRTLEDFTCFFESADNRTYDLLYKIDSFANEEKCSMSVQRTEEGTFLHICSIPEKNVLSYVEMFLTVVEHNTTIHLFGRNTSVEEHVLLDPPFDVSLHLNDHPGQLRVSWSTKDERLYEKAQYRIRFSSEGLKERNTTEDKILDSLVPGEEVMVHVQVQFSVENGGKGYWSRWSDPVQHMVPQSANDVSLTCLTTDLQNITCQWNASYYSEGNGYKLFYKSRPSQTSIWTEWTHCLGSSSGTCSFLGNVSSEVLVKLSGHPARLSRTFYTKTFTLSNSIKTAPPQHLRARLQKDSLCLEWEAPLPSLFNHLSYEVSYLTQRGNSWVSLFPEGSANEKCLEVKAGTRYSVKVRAQPDGPQYSGQWSDWSDVVTVDIPADMGTLLILCFLLLMIPALVCMSVFSMRLSKIKEYFWPPVPNLDKVLQGFLAEINRQKWDLSVLEKQCPEETTSSVVEIMSEEDVSVLGKRSPESTQLLLPEGPFFSKDIGDWSPGTDIFPDYVTLNKDSSIICPKGNKYVYEQEGEKGDPVVLLKTCHCSCTNITFCLCTEYLNHSYLPLTERCNVARGPGNLYSNFPCS